LADALPLSNPAEAAEAMADYLSTLNRIDVAQDSRAKIVERMTPVVEDIVASLYEHYGSLPLPLLPKQQRNADLARRLLQRTAEQLQNSVARLAQTPLPPVRWQPGAALSATHPAGSAGDTGNLLRNP
jgi:hypothetical protein